MKLIMEVVLSQVDCGKPATNHRRREASSGSGKWHAALPHAMAAGGPLSLPRLLRERVPASRTMAVEPPVDGLAVRANFTPV
jgi:hypothetical protein